MKKSPESNRARSATMRAWWRSDAGTLERLRRSEEARQKRIERLRYTAAAVR